MIKKIGNCLVSLLSGVFNAIYYVCMCTATLVFVLYLIGIALFITIRLFPVWF